VFQTTLFCSKSVPCSTISTALGGAWLPQYFLAICLCLWLSFFPVSDAQHLPCRLSHNPATMVVVAQLVCEPQDVVNRESFVVAASSILMTTPSRLILATLITAAISGSLKRWWFVITTHTPSLIPPLECRLIFLRFPLQELWVLASIEYT